MESDAGSGTWSVERVSLILGESAEMIELRSTSNPMYKVSVHKELLCYFSPYYRAALKGSFSESKQDHLDLKLDALECRMFVAWLYSGNLLGVVEGPHFALYVFADLTENLALRRSIMTKIVQDNEDGAPDAWMDQKPPSGDDIVDVVNALHPSSPLYRWLVEVFIHHLTPTNPIAGVEACIHDFPPEFFFKVAKGLVRKTNDVPCPCCSNPCNYHEHKDIREWKETCKDVDKHVCQPEPQFLKNVD